MTAVLDFQYVSGLWKLKLCCSGTSKEEQEVVRVILNTQKLKAIILETLQEDHSTQFG
ncbi:hypothetical protein CTI12_AA512850 [Artemisia annua]|uniref:Uncharacterized protein n=1 Tax=Artemisia annua TaxID=35608 RepID=A0A2U1LAH7_ARTAN|nr:hypothetical protein CTI12_AA512850 [Artemisia annua]